MNKIEELKGQKDGLDVGMVETQTWFCAGFCPCESTR